MKDSTRRLRRTAAAASAILATLASLSAFGAETDEIIVTGSRIARPETASTNPITVVGQAAIEASGAQNVSDFLRQLPSIGGSTYSSANSNFASFSAGVNTINLRSLGESRTLVLVNGRRVVAGLAGDSAVDFNLIPTDFIDRIEVVTGGASAVYGSEAMAGVVNVILKDNFDGLRFRAQGGTSQRGDSNKYLGAVTFGSSFAEGKGSMLFNITRDEDHGVRSRDRARSRIDTDVFSYPDPGFSTFSPKGRFQLYDDTGSPLELNVDGDDTFTFDANNNLKIPSDGSDGFNRAAYRRITVPLERTLFSSLFNYKLTENHSLYAEVTYGQTQSRSQIEPFAVQGDDIYGDLCSVDGTCMPVTNAFIPADIQAIIAGYGGDVKGIEFRKRLVAVDPRSSSADRQTTRFVLGAKGDLFSTPWSYDLYYMHGRTTDDQFSTGQVNAANMRFALDSIDDGSGNIICRDLIAQAQGCVPLNLFGNGSITPEMADYIRANQTRAVTITQEVVSAIFEGPMFDLPAGAARGVAGVERRRESSTEIWDALTNSGGNGGNQFPNVSGSYDVTEVFGEAALPLLADRPWARELTLEVAGRYADYSTAQVGGVFSWNSRLSWAPDEDVRFRLNYGEATRAPNISELYGGQAENFPTGIQDPCDGVTATSTGTYDAACRAIPGIASEIAANGSVSYTLADYQNINGFDGSNPELREETAKTWTLGVVLTPRRIEGLSIAIDYYNIRIDDAVDSIDRQVSIDECLATGSANFCDSVFRYANTGKLKQIDQTLINVATIRTAGIESQVRYGFDLPASVGGSLAFYLQYNYLAELEKVPFPGGDTVNYLGQLDASTLGRLDAGFRNRANLQTEYQRGPLTLTWTMNYLDSIRDFRNPEDAPDYDPTPGAPPPRFNDVGYYLYHNLSGRWDFGGEKKFSAYAGIDNLLDKSPPLLPDLTASGQSGTATDTTFYDAIGRSFYAGIEVNF